MMTTIANDTFELTGFDTTALKAKGHEYAGRARGAKSPAMALVYLRKAEGYYREAGRDDLADLCERMREAI